jgi:hypothetical protein
MRYDDDPSVFAALNGRGEEGETAESYWRKVSFAGIAAYDSPGDTSDAYHPTETDSSTTSYLTGMLNIMNTSQKPIRIGDRVFLGFPDVRSMRKNDGLLLASLMTYRDIDDLEMQEFTRIGGTEESLTPDYVRLFQEGVLKMAINALSVAISMGLVTPTTTTTPERTDFLVDLMSKLGLCERDNLIDDDIRVNFLTTMMGKASLFDTDTLGNELRGVKNQDLALASTALEDILTAVSGFEREMSKKAVGVALGGALPGQKFDILVVPMNK